MEDEEYNALAPDDAPESTDEARAARDRLNEIIETLSTDSPFSDVRAALDIIPLANLDNLERDEALKLIAKKSGTGVRVLAKELKERPQTSRRKRGR